MLPRQHLRPETTPSACFQCPLGLIPPFIDMRLPMTCAYINRTPTAALAAQFSIPPHFVLSIHLEASTTNCGLVQPPCCCQDHAFVFGSVGGGYPAGSGATCAGFGDRFTVAAKLVMMMIPVHEAGTRYFWI